MLEPEMAYATLDDVMDLSEQLLSYIATRVLEDRKEELKTLERVKRHLRGYRGLLQLAMVFSMLPLDSAGFSFSFASGVRRNRKRAGEQFADVGPIRSTSYSARSSSSVTGWSVNLLWLRASRNSRSSPAASSVMAVSPEGEG